LREKQARGEPTKIWNKNFICLIVANIMFCIGHASVNPLVATFTKYLNTSAELTGLLTGMFFGVSLLLKPFAGPALTKFDKRKLLIFVFTIGAVANVGYAMFHSVAAFVAFRFISGVQYGLVGALLMTTTADNLPKEKLAYGVGMFGIGSAIGNAVAPWLGESILRFGTNARGESFGFTLMFLFGALGFILAAVPAVILDPDRKTKEDIASTGAWYKNIFTIHALPMTIIVFLIMISWATVNTYVFEFGREQGIEGVSAFFLVLAITLGVSRPLSGFLTDRLGAHRVMFPAFIIFALALWVIGSSTKLWMLLIGAVLSAVGFGSTQPPLQAMCMQSETVLRRGVAGNTMYIGLDSGLFLGPLLGGFVIARANYSTMFKAGIVPVLLSMVCFAVVLPIYNRRLKELS